MTPARTVLDTNVLVSALLFPKGTVSWLREAWRSGAILPLASRDTVSELVRVLCYRKFRLAAAEREELLADYLPYCESVDVGEPPPVPECRDPFDRIFLEVAVAARADALVTGDEDLLAFAPDSPVAILTPRAFAKRLSD
ncbi:MAG: putative toxin-antitoxin system toxin component, PIN family [Gemmatimonadales bacterium]|nr:putative toxin-antitoxin system toxin component, PIN family [Gemmatimonadales bacterium]MXX78405.1 putative toxin-antitoxin system toxin component, PIN family [Gemmatimonadales bacterium]MYC88928.1 putative toxin-antitoxin system toxin component, PIN family [Candidatus Palauibacter denitrificans]